MKKHVARVWYTIEMTKQEYCDRDLDKLIDANEELGPALEAAGVVEYDWHPMFGPVVSILLDAEDDTEETWAEIWKALGVDPSAVD